MIPLKDVCTSRSSTKSKQFAAKVHGLKEINRQIIEETENPPTGKDIANCLKYFNTTLTEWVDDTISCFLREQFTFNHSRFPSANYQELYDVLLSVLENGKVGDNEEVVDELVKTLACVLPFLSDDVIVSMPITIAESLYDVPPNVQTKLIDVLVQYILPLIYIFMTPNQEESELNLSIASLLANILDSTAGMGMSTKVMECLMRFKKNVSTDLLTVLAYGTHDSLEASIQLLNRYFPPVDVDMLKVYQSPSYEPIKPFFCQYGSCKEDQAVKLCLDPSLCAKYLQQPPPVYFCQACFDGLHDVVDNFLFTDVIQPVGLVEQVCGNPDCRFGFMKALYFCFSLDCAKKNDNKPIRLCEDCHIRLHGNVSNPHMNHGCLKDLWITPKPEQTYLVDAIVRLCNEAQPDYQEKCLQMGIELDNLFTNQNNQPDFTSRNLPYIKKMFCSFNGLDLLKTTCPIPPSQFHLEHLTRLVAMLLVWIECVDYATHPEVAKVLVTKRQQAITWIVKVVQYDMNLFTTCLLPNPSVYAQVGHPWNMLTSVVRKDLEILQRLVTLSKQKLIIAEVWDHIMPIWMTEIKENIPMSEIKIFKKVLGKLFDMKSETRPTYALDFLQKRLESSILKQSQEGLTWVQILSYLDVQMDIKKLLKMFIEMVITKENSLSNVEHNVTSAFPFPDRETLHGVSNVGKLSRQNSLISPGTPTSESFPTLTIIKDDLSIAILIMDVLIKQLTLQKSSDGEVYIAQKESTFLSLFLVCILDQSFKSEYSDHVGPECHQCKVMNVIFYQIALLIDLAIKHQVTVDQAKKEYSKSIILKTSSNASHSSKGSYSSLASNNGIIEKESPKINKFLADPILEEEEKPVKFENNNDEFTEADTIVQEKDDLQFKEFTDESNKIDELQKQLHNNLPSQAAPDETLNRRQSEVSASILCAIPELQILEKLLQQLEIVQDISVMSHILGSIDILCIRGECLRMVTDEDMDLLQKLQTQTIIPILWNLLKSSMSNIAQRVVPLLLHCICLPFGAKKLCSEFEESFCSDDWKLRFAAVERIGLICQFLNESHVIDSTLAQATVVYGFTFLVSSTADVSQIVESRARSIIQSINISSLKIVYSLMEEHFLRVEDDGLLLLHVYQTIHLTIPESSPLSGELFGRLFKLVKKMEDMKKKMLLKDQTLIKAPHDYGDIIVMSLRRFPICRNNPLASTSKYKKFDRPGVVPLLLYQNCYTLQAGKSWRDAKTEHGAFFQQQFQPDMDNILDTVLDTVTEENEVDGKQILAAQMIVTADAVSTDQEVFSFLLAMVMEYLASFKMTKNEEIKKQAEAKENIKQHIILCIGHAMGLEQKLTSDGWLSPKRLNPSVFRKNPIVVTFLMNLPKLMDGSIEFGGLFLHLGLKVMEVCIKPHGLDFDQEIPSLLLLEPNLQYAWLLSLIVIIYKHNFTDHHKIILSFADVVKDTLAGHDHFVCLSKKPRNLVSMRHVVNMKINMNAKKKIKKNLADDSNSLELREFTEMNESCPDVLSEISVSDNKATPSASSMYNQSINSTEEILLGIQYKICPMCKVPLFQYEDNIINLSIITLMTLFHRDTEMAAPMLIEVILCIARKANVISAFHPGKAPQLNLSTTASIAQQFLRGVFHKLSQSRVFAELYRSENLDEDFHLITSTVLTDFSHLTQICPIKLAIMDLVEGKSNDRICLFLDNMAGYLKYVLNHNQWIALQKTFEDFYSNIIPLIPNGSNMDSLLDIMSMLLHSQKVTFMVLIDLIDNVMSHIIKHCQFNAGPLQDLCGACVDTFSKERDQYKLTRKVCLIFTMVLSSKISLSEHSIISLIKFFCGQLDTTFDFTMAHTCAEEISNRWTSKIATKAMDCLDEHYSHEMIDYLKTPARRLKDKDFVDRATGDSFHSTVKLSVAQFLAVSFTSSKKKLFTKIMSPFIGINIEDLDNQNSFENPLASLDFQELVAHFRALCWILIGGLNHFNMTGNLIQLIPLSNAVVIAEFVKTIFEEFLKGEDNYGKGKSRERLHLSFLLAQILTVYMEKEIPNYVQQTVDINPLSVVKEFWSRLTPSIYRLLQKHDPKLQYDTIQMFSKMVDNLSIHCPRIFIQLYPLWVSMLQLYLNEIQPSVIRNLNANKTSQHGDSYKQLLAVWLSEVQLQLSNPDRMKV